VELLDRRRFDFSLLMGAATKELVVVKCLATPAFRDARLQVRVHEVDIGGGDESGTLDVFLKSTAPSRDDPGVDFVGEEALASAVVSATVGAGTLFDLSVKPAFGKAVRLLMRATQSGPDGPYSLVASLSASLVVRA
jgi:hypothetical protein